MDQNTQAILDAMRGDQTSCSIKPLPEQGPAMVPIPKALYDRLVYLGIIDPTGVRDHNEGKSNYANGRLIQPWAVWLDWDLKPWDADIVKRIGREKEEDGLTLKEQRRLDYRKIRHTSDERIRQLDIEIEQERRLRNE